MKRQVFPAAAAGDPHFADPPGAPDDAERRPAVPPPADAPFTTIARLEGEVRGLERRNALLCRLNQGLREELALRCGGENSLRDRVEDVAEEAALNGSLAMSLAADLENLVAALLERSVIGEGWNSPAPLGEPVYYPLPAWEEMP